MNDAIPRHRQDWNDLADFDAYWAVLTRRDRKYGRWDRDEFYATGEAEIAAMLDRCAELGRPDGFRRALDYGCGLGRLSRALAGRFGECLGVDISEKMVERAREMNADRPNCAFAVGSGVDLGDLQDGSFDLVYCSLVLQHLPSVALAEGLIRDFIRLLGPGGIAVFQMPSRIEWWARPRLRRRVYAVLRRIGTDPRLIIGRGRSNPMRMNALPARRVRAAVEAASGQVLQVLEDSESAPQFHSLVYYAARV